jgi:hypothetical protein
MICFLILLIAQALHCSIADENALLQLRTVQSKINNQTEAFCYHSHSGTRQAFLSNQFGAMTENLNVLIYPFCLTTNELGNRLGNYFNEVGCAEASGINFLTIHKTFQLEGSFHRSNTSDADIIKAKQAQLAFLDALPDAIVHPNPVDRASAVANVNNLCRCTRYCWQQKAPWTNHTNSIKSYMQLAVKAYMRKLGDVSTEVDIVNDKSNAVPGQRLPLVPDATIQYRCGDNLAFSFMYGILPYTVFDKRIPADAKYIYVLSDHPSRAPNSPNTGRCKLILDKLFEYLLQKFPNAVVVVKRGGDIFLDYVRLALSPTVVCSASSYCFWPALSNPGQIHFPLTYLIAGADSVELATDFGSNFHWITDAQIITGFKGLRPWTQIIDVLEGKLPTPG